MKQRERLCIKLVGLSIGLLVSVVGLFGSLLCFLSFCAQQQGAWWVTFMVGIAVVVASIIALEWRL